MQIRCSHCHKPFALNKDAVHAALDTVTAEGLNHYNAYCPHCRRANRISKEELHHAAPDWVQPSTAQNEPTETSAE
jgi:phage FluMu protein Com